MPPARRAIGVFETLMSFFYFYLFNLLAEDLVVELFGRSCVQIVVNLTVRFHYDEFSGRSDVVDSVVFLHVRMDGRRVVLAQLYLVLVGVVAHFHQTLCR